MLFRDQIFARKYRALFQGDGFVVVNAAHLAPHDAQEKGIDTVQDLGAAAEVLVQIDPLR